MKAIVKATGEIVDVYERYDDLAMETVFEELAGSYRPDELDFSVDEAEETESDLRISVAKLRDILEQAAKDYNAPQYFIDEIINQVKKSI